MSRWCLIVATRGRTHEVGELLKSLAGLAGDTPRIVLVDQNADGRLDGTVAAWAGRLRLEHLVVPPRGVSQARNAGIAQLRDEPFVAFPDDDCRYLPDTLIQAEAAFAALPTAEALISSWHGLDEPPPPPPAKADPVLRGRITSLRQSPTYTLFFRRTAIARAQSFDETMGPGGGTPWLCGEDADFLLRAGGLDGRAGYAPLVRVSHPRVESAGDAAKAYGYGRGRMRVLRKHGFPWWFELASIVHPLVGCLGAGAAMRRFRWHLARGRLHEWLHPHRLPHP